ncbi:tetraspanin-9 [Sarcoptes scabiei]|uniref:DDRGK domain-containing protein 1 n=1 Tax=Sarcoptes scabiei TaxID=52283 RepID=A0A132A428_SARSC|nr:DDRGK domain-containing protein 1-like protein [Sarcoptes scabiei]UXI17236.1 tetraspanin-9 [Sarcoptes scabiei]
MEIVFLTSLAGSLIVIALIILIAIRGTFKNDKSQESEDSEQSSRSLRSPESLGLRQRGRSSRISRASRSNPSNDAQISNDDSENSTNEIDDFGDEDDSLKPEASIKGKIGVKKMRKLEMKAEKKLMRERELQEREERKRIQEESEKKLRLQQELEEAEEKAKAEEERLKREQKEREEHELYLQMKKNFTIDEEGYDGDENDEENQNKLQTFIDYIKEKKVIHMDELAGHFKIKTSVVVQQLQNILEQELIVGVIDDRGKFIYITNDELNAVARFIKQRGRVSLTDLAENSNNLIKLIPVEAN